jgi:hypothetical protein
MVKENIAGNAIACSDAVSGVDPLERLITGPGDRAKLL